jgi:hypothetical protein
MFAKLDQLPWVVRALIVIFFGIIPLLAYCSLAGAIAYGIYWWPEGEVLLLQEVELNLDQRIELGTLRNSQNMARLSTIEEKWVNDRLSAAVYDYYPFLKELDARFHQDNITITLTMSTLLFDVTNHLELSLSAQNGKFVFHTVKTDGPLFLFLSPQELSDTLTVSFNKALAKTGVQLEAVQIREGVIILATKP